jgi:hypothetical protein
MWRVLGLAGGVAFAGVAAVVVCAVGGGMLLCCCFLNALDTKFLNAVAETPDAVG